VCGSQGEGGLVGAVWCLAKKAVERMFLCCPAQQGMWKCMYMACHVCPSFLGGWVGEVVGRGGMGVERGGAHGRGEAWEAGVSAVVCANNV